MKELSSLPSIPLSITIGMFDGVHLGHRALIQKLKAVGLPTAIVTFSPHPRTVLSSQPAPIPITTQAQKKALLSRLGIDYLVTIPFTKQFASITYDQWLSTFPSGSHLILGEGATFGYQRQGTEENVRAFAKNHPLQVEYLPKLAIHGEIVSSSLIRQAIATGDKAKAELLLGYPLTLLEELHV